jgi:thiol-disulfide isomerase/thioredoxin
MRLRTPLAVACAAMLAAAGTVRLSGQEQLVHVALGYGAPGHGPAPNFSPKGTQVPLTDLPAGAALPPGATRPARAGTIKIGPDDHAWMGVLATADPAHPQDLCRLFLDRNRNGRFDDDGPPLEAAPSQNAKTKAWWTSFNKIELSVPYGRGDVEPYLINVWLVRDDDAPAPGLLRYSVGSWRVGTATVNGVQALVAAMDSDNNAVFGTGDWWSVLQASAPDAAKAVLSMTEARPTDRLMFVEDGTREQVLEFRSFSPDGRSLTFAVVNRPVTKAQDRAGDDPVADERSRPRTKTPVAWGHDFAAATARAKAEGRNLIVDFEATWCGPCKSMDQWVWTDAEVASVLHKSYVGVKLDGDIEKALVKRFKVAGYPTMIVLDPSGKELRRAVGYESSKEILTLLGVGSVFHRFSPIGDRSR